MTSLVRKLFSGPIDLVGDVHGEIGALETLLDRLGYAANGTHPQARRLVFLGDLTDRGPDSPAVIQRVSELIAAERAQCVLGNHDLNILLKDRKHDNHWFYGEPWALDGETETPARLADEATRQRTLDHFRQLPIALERDDLRVVHACWDDAAIEAVRNETDAAALLRQSQEQIEASFADHPEWDEVDRGLALQNLNPVRLLTSGREQRAAEPFFASGKLRRQERAPWWNAYDAEVLCVYGHYSRFRDAEEPMSNPVCIDFAVAKRWKERQEGKQPKEFRSRLGALRLPERELVYDQGESERLAE
ncbi:metallophosphoesterase [Adhaeretor mobilis]|uniref:Bis(5'-nucleosyl)-tetraphosphatase PrpE [asymmetrical] n=1 Tax=Adhaeretor mobilis TaxID=1930276 RepID=A0A517MS42_9BACT|nr:metallophosphoesterase [Adhaeretor mobilis]QDS97696.1 Bis(5'-nucleosyl)-tetraphosphatase PrpE [asymmetrical] [Adhaeretor mobilis]